MDLPFSYHYKVEEDLGKLSTDLQKRILNAIENRLGKAPEKYGDPLRETLAGLWKLRVGDYRVIYEVKTDASEIIIWGILHRKDVYDVVTKRWHD